MIGGSDIAFQHAFKHAGSALELVAKTLRFRWPKAVYQNADTGVRYASYATVPFGQMRELFVYKDEDAFASWEKLGADASNRNTMVHALASNDSVTVVLDEIDAFAKSVLESVKESMERSFLA